MKTIELLLSDADYDALLHKVVYSDNSNDDLGEIVITQAILQNNSQLKRLDGVLI